MDIPIKVYIRNVEENITNNSQMMGDYYLTKRIKAAGKW